MTRRRVISTYPRRVISTVAMMRRNLKVRKEKELKFRGFRFTCSLHSQNIQRGRLCGYVKCLEVPWRFFFFFWLKQICKWGIKYAFTTTNYQYTKFLPSSSNRLLVFYSPIRMSMQIRYTAKTPVLYSTPPVLWWEVHIKLVLILTPVGISLTINV